MTTKRTTMVNSYGDKRAPWEIRQAAFLEWLEAAPEGIAIHNHSLEKVDHEDLYNWHPVYTKSKVNKFDNISVVYEDRILTNLTFINSLEGDS